MPQIAQIATSFGSQLFWLIVVFGLIYIVIGRGMVPKISGTIEARDARIGDDLAAAERARAQADDTEEAYRLQTAESRAAALKVTQAAKEASVRETEQRVAAGDAETAKTTEAAEARIRAASQAAMAEIDTVAAEAAQEMVAKLSGASVTREEALAVVQTDRVKKTVYG